MRTALSLAVAAAVASVAYSETVSGLEAYGDLALVDSIDCADDAAHEFHQYPDGGSKVETILGSPCRTLAHQPGSAAYFSYRLGKGKGLVAGDMYLLVAEYPDDVPRTMTLLNRAMDSRNGFHTGRTIGDTLNAHIIPQTHCESWEVPLAGEYKRIEQLVVLNEKVYPHDSTDSKKFLDSETDGFDVIFQLFSKEDAPDSAGAAIKSIRLYRVNNEAALAATINYPRDAPRRYLTFREEMADGSGRSFNADWRDWARHKARLMKVLGINCYSRDILEFGYNQNFDVTCGGKYADGNLWCHPNDDYYTDEVGIYNAAGLYQLPYYEYAGSRGTSGYGYKTEHQAVPLFTAINQAEHANKFVKASNGASAANVDLTDKDTLADFERFLECTILRYKDQANFVGAWIRNRGSMPMSFGDNALARFNKATDRSGDDAITREKIIASAGQSTDGEAYRHLFQMCEFTDIYKEYRNWWYGKRADFLSDVQMYLETNGVAGAKVFFSGCVNEAGLIGKKGDSSNSLIDFVAAQDSAKWQELSGNAKGVQSIGQAAGYQYPTFFLDKDEWTFWETDGGKTYPFEYNHAAPKGDPQTYANRENIAISYPYNCIYTTITGDAADYRNASGDLFFSRHYCLYEGCGSDLNGYFTCEMDRADRACMLPELYAVAYQDPTTIGFLQGNQLARNFTIPFREFSENFLSLPAVKGTVLQGGGWGNGDVTIRKYVAGGDQYYAVINTSGSPVASGWHIITDDDSVTKLYETVSGTEHAVGSRYMRYELKPYQLLCFSTAKPGSTLWAVASSDVADRSAKVVATVTTLLDDETGTLSGLVSASSDFSNAMTLDGKSVTAAGEFTWTLSGLMPVTTYYVKLTYTPNEGSAVEKTLTFRTLTPADWPSASELAIDSVGVTNLTAKVTVEKFGEGAAEATVVFELAKSEDMAGAIERSVVFASAGEAAAAFGGLNSETEYYVRATVSNSLANVVTLDPVSAVTKKVTTAAPFTGMYMPGLTQVKYGCEKSKYPDFSVTLSSFPEADLDRTPGVVMSETGADYENPLSGTKWSWVNNTTYSYFGEMWFEGGRTYDFFHCVDDGVAIELDDEWLTRQSAENVSGFNAGVTKVQKTYGTSGWHAIRVFVYDWDGGKGYVEGKVGFKMGLGWNTNGCYEVKSDTAAKWSALVDPGDGSLLRTRTSVPELIRVSGVRQAGRRIWATVATELYDDDCRLEVSVSKVAGEKTVVKTIDPADRAASSVDVDTDYDVSGTNPLHVAAHLVNERTGYDYWTEPDVFVPQDDTPRCEFGEIEAAVDLGGTNATIRTTVVDVSGEDTKVELKVNGETMNTWTGVQPADVLEFKADVSRGSTNVYAFVFTSGTVTKTSDAGVFIATTYTDWFTVDFEHDEAYRDGTEWMTVSADRGSWSVTGEDGGSELKGRSAVALKSSVVVYTPTSSSETNADAKVRGLVKVSPGGRMEDMSEHRPCVAFTFVGMVPYVYIDGTWTALRGGSPLSVGDTVEYVFALKFMQTEIPPQVKVTVGDWSCDWMPAADMPRWLSGVKFAGNGEFGSFRGAYYSLLPDGCDDPVVRLVRPEFATDGTGLSLENAKFTVTIANPVKGAWYTVFVAERLTDAFVAAADSKQFVSDAPTFSLTVDADRPSLFARIVISHAQYHQGDPL